MEDKLEEPKEGMMFNTIDEVKGYYKRYGNELGFPIKSRTSKKGDDGEVIYVSLACSLAGKPRSTSRNIRKRLPSSKTDCKAKLSVAICPDGKWQVTSFKAEHNHALNPGVPSFELRDREGIRVNKDPTTCLVEADGLEIVPILEKDFSNHTEKVTRLRLIEGDASALHNYFMKMQTDNSNFFCMIDLDDEGCLRNAFWADARSRTAYEEFGDVIAFDTTYLTNNYDMPFAPFVGVNHHGQSMLLGCGLLSGDDIETFTWLFQCFLACMSDRAPKAIITDQDNALQKAVEIVFPNTRHRWCLWHITKKLPDYLRGYDQYDSIKFVLQNVVYESLTCDEFEQRWNIMIEKYNLQSSEWFHDLYEERHRWVPAFLKDTFWAGMCTTQRSGFFDGYVNSKTTIKQFVDMYEAAMRSKVERENHEDLNSSSLLAPCITHYAMEKQFQDAYTTTKFKDFQEELNGKIYCEVSSVKKDVTLSEYEISEDLKIGDIDRRATFEVSLSHEDCGIHCSCCLFESGGILCRHAIAVLTHSKVLKVPEKYILPRWRKDLKRRHTKVRICYADNSDKPEALRYEIMCNAFYEVAELSNGSEDKTKTVMDWISELKKKVKRDDAIFGSSQPAITLNDGSPNTDGDVIPESPPLKRKLSKVDGSTKSKDKQKRMKSKRRHTSEGNKGDRGSGTHMGGRNDALPPHYFPNPAWAMWGVPPNGQQVAGSFPPPMFVYGRGYGMGSPMPMPPHPGLPRDAASTPTGKKSKKSRKILPRASDQVAPPLSAEQMAQMMPFWGMAHGMGPFPSPPANMGNNQPAQQTDAAASKQPSTVAKPSEPTDGTEPTVIDLEGDNRPSTENRES